MGLSPAEARLVSLQTRARGACLCTLGAVGLRDTGDRDRNSGMTSVRAQAQALIPVLKSKTLQMPEFPRDLRRMEP